MKPFSDKPSCPAIKEAHFPSRLHLFVWRNWEWAGPARMARLLGVTERQLAEVGFSMGLPPFDELEEDVFQRGSITIIRQNWHLLPEEQIIALLGWDRSYYERILREEDFLWHKLGDCKPVAKPLRWHEPTAGEVRRAGEIAGLTRPFFESGTGERPYAFLTKAAPVGKGGTAHSFDSVSKEGAWSLLHSYFSTCGDLLLEEEHSGFPPAYLDQLAATGVKALWIPVVLSTLAPSQEFPEFGQRWEERLANLRTLVARLAERGLKLYLYLNEPRAMPPEFFERHPDVQGAPFRDLVALCTSVPRVRQWIGDSLRHLVSEVPDLGGFFAIIMSENHTNCFSHGETWGKGSPKADGCPRCSQRQSWETLAELAHCFRDAIRPEGKGPELIFWDWGWGDQLSRELMPLLPKDVSFLTMSEFDVPFRRGRVHGRVHEYSLSSIGPGPRAKRQWKLAKAAGLRPLAKVQANNSWEMAAVPFLPVLQQVAEHGRRLQQHGVRGAMLSWTCGGYPSPNLEVMQAFFGDEVVDVPTLLRATASRRYGARLAREAVSAWGAFSRAFRQYPYIKGIYTIPVQHGPANLLRLERVEAPVGMILFPHDRAPASCWPGEPPDVRDQFRKMANLWERGVQRFERIVKRIGEVPEAFHDAIRLDLAIAQTCLHHFHSVANQIDFYLLRDSGSTGSFPAMLALIRADRELAAAQVHPALFHSEIAYEASNHYFYRPLDLIEKVIQCDVMERELEKRL